MIWAEAEGCRVVDDRRREYLDLTAGFGVAALGHRNPRILEAWRAQPVVHALGDLADAEVTAELRARLPYPSKLGVTGEDAVEIALRTALLATGQAGDRLLRRRLPRDRAARARGDRESSDFREPFAAWLPGPVHRLPYGEDPGPLPADAGCVIVEPVQGRGGAVVPPTAFLRRLRERCDEAGALLIVDAIYAGLGRTGACGRARRSRTCSASGKALGGGLPLSAALFLRPEFEALWDLGPEDVYTHTHVGSPLACAAALVVLDEVPPLLRRVRRGRRAVRARGLARGRAAAREAGRRGRGAASAACSSSRRARAAR